MLSKLEGTAGQLFAPPPQGYIFNIYNVYNDFHIKLGARGTIGSYGYVQLSSPMMTYASPLFAFATFVGVASSAVANEAPASHRTRIEINLRTQTLVYYRGNNAVLQTGISTGKRGFETPTGSYAVSDKCLNRRSSIYHVQMPFFLRLSGSVYGIHYGYNPGYAASHGCIRVATAQAAEELYELVPIGTPVKIRPGSRFDAITSQSKVDATSTASPKRTPLWKRLFPGSAPK